MGQSGRYLYWFSFVLFHLLNPSCKTDTFPIKSRVVLGTPWEGLTITEPDVMGQFTSDCDRRIFSNIFFSVAVADGIWATSAPWGAASWRSLPWQFPRRPFTASRLPCYPSLNALLSPVDSCLHFSFCRNCFLLYFI